MVAIMDLTMTIFPILAGLLCSSLNHLFEDEIEMEEETPLSILLTHHMQSAATAALPDERDFLRLWRRRFRDVVTNQRERMFTFFKENDTMNTKTFLSEIVCIPAGASWFHENVVSFDSAQALQELDSETGICLKTMQAQLNQLMTHYLGLLKDLFEVDERLHSKMEQIALMETNLENLGLISTEGTSCADLQTSILAYVRALYREKKIEDDYVVFMALYTKVNALRNVLLPQIILRHDTEGPPFCSICVTEKICGVLLPCGHTFCNNCTARQRSQCYICRTHVKERHRIHFA